MKKVLTWAFIFLICVNILSGCTSYKAMEKEESEIDLEQQEDEATQTKVNKQIVIKIANYFPEDHPQNKALDSVFKKIVEEESKGEIKVEIYPNNTLGSEKEFAEGTKIGSIEMSVIGVILSDQFIETKLLEFPYLFESIEEGIEILNQPQIRDNLSKGFSEIGLKSLGYSVNGRRVITNSVRPINDIEDCKGIKLRVPPLKHFVDMGNAMGFDASSITMPEVYMSLQQKVVDAVENPPATILSSGWYSAQKYLALTYHMISFNDVIINENFYNSLSDEHKALIERAIQEYFIKETKIYLETESEVLSKLEASGMQITIPNQEPFKKAMEPVFNKYCEESPEFEETLELIREAQKNRELEVR